MASRAQYIAGIKRVNTCLAQKVVYLLNNTTGILYNSGGASNINSTALSSYTDAQLVTHFEHLCFQAFKEIQTNYFSIYGVPYMTAIAAITINDGQVVPVAHTFAPVQSLPTALYRETVSGLALVGQGTIRGAIVADKGNGLNKVRVAIDMPALEVVTGQNSAGYSAAPKVAYSNRVNIDFILPSRGTNVQRKDLRVLLKNLLDNAQVIDMIENLVSSY